MGTNERRLDMLEKRARDALSEVAERDARRIVAALSDGSLRCTVVLGISVKRWISSQRRLDQSLQKSLNRVADMASM